MHCFHLWVCADIVHCWVKQYRYWQCKYHCDVIISTLPVSMHLCTNPIITLAMQHHCMIILYLQSICDQCLGHHDSVVLSLSRGLAGRGGCDSQLSYCHWCKVQLGDAQPHISVYQYQCTSGTSVSVTVTNSVALSRGSEDWLAKGSYRRCHCRKVGYFVRMCM